MTTIETATTWGTQFHPYDDAPPFDVAEHSDETAAVLAFAAYAKHLAGLDAQGRRDEGVKSVALVYRHGDDDWQTSATVGPFDNDSEQVTAS